MELLPFPSSEAFLSLAQTLSLDLNETDDGSSSSNGSLGSGQDGNGTTEGGYLFIPLPWWRQVIWSILFGAIVIVATVGNLVVVWIVLAHKRMRTVTNYLLVNLSIADAMVSTINVIPNYIYMSTQHWPFGALYCKIVQFVAVLSVCASVFSLMAIAFDRLVLIVVVSLRSSSRHRIIPEFPSVVIFISGVKIPNSS
jgi:tachykinin-like receptor